MAEEIREDPPWASSEKIEEIVKQFEKYVKPGVKVEVKL